MTHPMDKKVRTETTYSTPNVSITYKRGTTMEEVLELVSYMFVGVNIVARKKVVVEDEIRFPSF